MREKKAEAIVEFHCTKPLGVMIRSRDSLLYDEAAFDELIAAIEALAKPYKRRAHIPRRIAACLAGLSQEINWTATRAEDEGDEDAARRFREASSRVWDAISRALWPGEAPGDS